jgi:hypothetical protein
VLKRPVKPWDEDEVRTFLARVAGERLNAVTLLSLIVCARPRWWACAGLPWI